MRRLKTPTMTGLAQDFRYALRQLRKSPAFLAVVVLSLGLGIGANSTIFSVLNAVLYRPMPYDHPERLVAIWETEQGHPDSSEPPPIAEMNDWKMQNHVFEDIALTSSTEGSTLSGLGEAEPIWVQDVTPNFFSLLGARPVLGRIFAAEEMQDTTQTVVIGNSFWKRKFNGDPNVLGKTFTIQGVVSTVVGVMPAGFAPFYGDQIDMWQPINPESSRYAERIDHWLMPVARLKPGVTLAQAQVEMDVIARRLEQAYPKTNKGIGKKLVPLHQELFDWTGKSLYPLFGAVFFVLLIACVNVANLLQSRTEVRRKEYALRAALGSGRRRLIQQLLAESGLLALLGGGFGVLISFAGIELFHKLAGDFPNAGDIRVDAPVLLFTLGVSMLTAFLFGLAPAIQASRPDLNLALREGEGRTSTASRSWVRHSLAVSEVALAMLLLVGAGLMINTMLRLHRIDPGFDPKNVTTMTIQLPEGGKYLERVPGTDMEKPLPLVKAFSQRVLERVATLPGVESAGLIGSPEDNSFSILGHAPPPPDKRPHAVRSVVSASLFRTMKVPLIKGRYLDENDVQTAPWTVVVNETFVRRYFPNEDPIGQQLMLRYDPYPVDEDRPRQIVGIVGDVRHFGPARPVLPFAYTSYLQQSAVFPGGSVTPLLNPTLRVRTAPGLTSQGASLAAAAKKIVAELDPDLPVTHVMTMDQALEQSMGDTRFYMDLFGIFAGIAVLLAVIGIYGVMSYFVSERTHEIGIRVALGAFPSDVISLVGKLGLKLTLIGVAVGIGLAIGLTRLMAGFLVGVKPIDPVTYAVVAVVLVGVALLACYIPARRASKVDPMVALRYE
jgi:putative ABC transport system permease protein